MARVWGTLTDFSLRPMPGLSPELRFIASSAGVDDSILVNRPIVATPDAAGNFVVDLHPLNSVRPPMFYRIEVWWLDEYGNFSARNDVPGELHVTESGGPVAEQMQTGSTPPGLTWVGWEPPPTTGPFTSWLQQDPSNMDNDPRPEAGNYYEVS